MKILLVLMSFLTLSNCEYMRVCYYTNWAQYRSGNGNYVSSNYKTGLCTHLIYAFAKVWNKGDGTFPILPYETNDIGTGYPEVSSMYLFHIHDLNQKLY